MRLANYLKKIYEVVITDDVLEFINEVTVSTDVATNFMVPMINKEKFKKLNQKTGRMKTRKKIKYYKTDIPPEERSFKNLPRYANKKAKCRFQDWLCIDEQGGGKKDGHLTPNYYGKSTNGKWYGWSHRAVYGFKAGMEVKKGHIAIRPGRSLPYKIKNDADAKWHAIKFAKEVG